MPNDRGLFVNFLVHDSVNKQKKLSGKPLQRAGIVDKLCRSKCG